VIRVAAAYHPAYILRNPASALATEAHLRTVRDYLFGDLKMDHEGERFKVEYAPDPPDYSIRRLSLDIETYGILKGRNQTQFHPLKSEVHDKIPRDRMVVTVGLTWRDPDGELQHALFLMRDAAHRRILSRWFKKITNDPDFAGLLGQNLTFDLMYLRYCWPGYRQWLCHPLPLTDLIITNYLHDEGRPERSLKSLAPLLRVTQYDGVRGDDGTFRQYDGPGSPSLHQYNIQDTMATLLCQEKLERAIRSFYGQNTEKLSDFTQKWFSDLIWFVIWASEAGISMDLGELARLDEYYRNRRDTLIRLARDYFDFPLQGKGSDKAKRAILDQAVDLAGKDLPTKRLVLTPKQRKISFAAENRNLLLSVLPHESWVAPKLRLIKRYQDVDKMIGSYLVPIHEGARRGKDISTRHINGVIYPRLFPVPSEFDDGSSGGTKQARIVYKGPAAQTFPPPIKRCISCRFRGGHLIWADASQIELRVAALLSGDPVMCAEYRGKPDLHGKTARLMFGDDIVSHPQYKEKYRQAGKAFNFRALYRGGAQIAQDTLMKDWGIELSLGRIQEIDDAYWHRHTRLREWQDSLFDFVRKHGYYTLPLTGQSRLFLGSEEAQRAQINEICNLPVQAVAANIALSAQVTLWQRIKSEGLETLISLNVYDAMCMEVPLRELNRVLQLMHEVLPNPPYFEALCREIGRDLPLVWEFSVDDGEKQETGTNSCQEQAIYIPG